MNALTFKQRTDLAKQEWQAKRDYIKAVRAHIAICVDPNCDHEITKIVTAIAKAGK